MRMTVAARSGKAGYISDLERAQGGAKWTAKATQQAVKQRLQAVLSPETSAVVELGKTSYPTIALKSHHAFRTLSGTIRAAIFQYCSARTPLESGGGVCMVGTSRSDGRVGFSLDDLTRITEDVYE